MSNLLDNIPAIQDRTETSPINLEQIIRPNKPIDGYGKEPEARDFPPATGYEQLTEIDQKGREEEVRDTSSSVSYGLSRELDQNGRDEEVRDTPPADGYAAKDIPLRLGEHIGGSRYDRARKLTETADTDDDDKNNDSKKTPKDNIPAWQKPYVIIHDDDPKISSLMRQRIESKKPENLEDKWHLFHHLPNSYLKYSLVASSPTREKAQEMIPIHAVSLNHDIKFSLVHDPSNPDKPIEQFHVRRLYKTKRPLLVAGPFNSNEEALKHMATNPLDILNFRPEPGYGEALLYTVSIAERKGGPTWRENDRDVKPEEFMDTFGFRGVEFGLWNNQEDRRVLLNQSYDSLLDLADLLGIQPKAISLDGSLGLAFGARGAGYFSAHYECGHTVINLTKTRGAGALAHEWFHALDCHLGRLESKLNPETLAQNISMGEGPEKWSTEPAIPIHNNKQNFDSTTNFLWDLRQTMSTKLINFTDDITHVKALEEDSRQNFLKAWERMVKIVFPNVPDKDTVTIDNILKKLIDYPEPVTIHSQGVKTNRKGIPYYSKGYLSNNSFNQLNELLGIHNKGKTGFISSTNEKSKGILYNLVEDYKSWSFNKERLENASNNISSTKWITTDFTKEAGKLDAKRSVPYWTKQREKGARAFSAFIQDLADDRGYTNTFLTAATRNSYFEELNHTPRPYPEDEERLAINNEFQKVFDKLKNLAILKPVNDPPQDNKSDHISSPANNQSNFSFRP